MTTKIHYDDNIFYLDSMVKTVKSGLSLDIDPEYFIDKVIEDILFLDSALLRTFASLKANFYLIKRGGTPAGPLRTDRISSISSIPSGTEIRLFLHLSRFSRNSASPGANTSRPPGHEEAPGGIPERVLPRRRHHLPRGIPFLLKEDENREET
jgi:hypothetical protein